MKNALSARRLAFLALFAVTVPAHAKTELMMLVKMMPAQAAWVKKNVLEPFEKENDVAIRLQNFETYQELETVFSRNQAFDIIKVPMDRAVAFREGGYITPVSSIADSAKLSEIRRDYVLPPLAVNLDTVFYVPRKMECRIMVYRVSKVREAANQYLPLVADINLALARYNETGLPNGYVLEDDPSEWDYYDVLVAGCVWAKKAGGVNPGRIGHRGANYEGTMLRIVDRAFQFGATRGEIPYLTSRPVTEAFEWEFIYSKMKAYNQDMFTQNWKGKDLWIAFGKGDIYLSFLTQLDCFFLLGTGEPDMQGYFKDPEDVGFAVMPRAASLMGEENLFVNRNVTTGGWVWALGKESSNKALALKLILQMTSRENQEREFNAFGTFPTRRALLKENNDKLYLKRWQNRMLQASIRQIELNRYTVLPTFRDMEALQNRYYKVMSMFCHKNENINTLEMVRRILMLNETPSSDGETP